MPFRTGGRSGRGNCPNNDVAPQEIFRNRVRRAHPKPFRLRRGIAARGLHGNTARRLRDGRRQPADNTLYRSSGRHGYGRAGRCVVRRHQGTVVGGLRNGISSHERNPCIAANRSCLRSVRHRNDRIGNIYGIHVARILVEEVHPVHCRRLSHSRGILPIISGDEVHRLPKGNTWSLRHVPKIRNSVLVISANTLFILPYPFHRFVVPVIKRINRLYPVCGSPPAAVVVAKRLGSSVHRKPHSGQNLPPAASAPHSACAVPYLMRPVAWMAGDSV